MTTSGTAMPAPADPTARAAIEATGLTKRFGTILALDHLDLVVPAGSIFGLLGPNGAGKTTTLRILTGLARATSGSASVAGVPVGLDDPELHRRIGYLDQDPRFYSWMKGRELLELVGRLHGLDGPALRSSVAEMLERTGLTAAGGRRIGGYSGGMRQRLGIAQALLHSPATPVPRRAGQLARPGGPARPARTHRGSPGRRRSSSRPTFSPTWSGSATGWRSWTAGDASPRGRSRTSSRRMPARSSCSCPHATRRPGSPPGRDAPGRGVDDGRHAAARPHPRRRLRRRRGCGRSWRWSSARASSSILRTRAADARGRLPRTRRPGERGRPRRPRFVRPREVQDR